MGNQSVIHAIVCEGNLVQLKQLLLSNEYSVHSPDPANGWPLLFYAIQHHQQAVLQYLIECGHEEDEVSRDFEGNTALMISVKCKNQLALNYFMRQFPQTISLANHAGQTAFMIAAQYGNMTALHILLEHFQNYAALTRGQVVLASPTRHVQTTVQSSFPLSPATLNQYGQELMNHIDNDGSNAVHYAAAHGHFDCIYFLALHNADLNLQNKKGWTPKDYAYSLELKQYIDECESLIKESKKPKRKMQTGSNSAQNSITSCSSLHGSMPMLNRQTTGSSQAGGSHHGLASLHHMSGSVSSGIIPVVQTVKVDLRNLI